MEQTDENKINEMITTILSNYLGKENMPIDYPFPEIKITLVESIFEAIRVLRPDWGALNEEEVNKCSGYTLMFENKPAELLIDKNFLFNSCQKNFFWIEVLIHEITHI